MRKPRLSFTSFKFASRCKQAAALRISTDPNTGDRYEPYYASSTKSKMHQGTFFEECITGVGKHPRSSSKDRREYEYWRDVRTGKDHKAMLERIRVYGEDAKQYLDLTPGNFEAGVHHEWEFPHFIFDGVEDYYGAFKREGYSYDPCVLDFKFSGDPMELWDLDGWQFSGTQLWQSPFYALVRGMKAAKSNTFIEKAMIGYGTKTILWPDALELVAKWGEQTTLPYAGYLVYENAGMPVGAKPIPPVSYGIEVLPQDLFMMYCEALTHLKDWLMLRANIGTRSKRIEQFLNPSPGKCKGKNPNLTGKCPFLYHCEYGRAMLGKHTHMTTTDIRELL